MSGLASFLTLPFMAWAFYVDLPATTFLLAISFLFLASLFPLRLFSGLKSGLILLVGLFYLSGQKELLLFYPALASAVICVLFIASMLSPPCLVLRMARKMEPDLPVEAEVYCRVVNLVWVGVLAFNSLFAYWTATRGSLEIWSFYNGFLSYLIIGVVMITEYAVRKIFRARIESRAGGEL